MKTIHVMTVVQMHLATVDADGNLVRLEPLAVNISKFSAGEFAQAYEALAKARAEKDGEGTSA